MVGSQQSRAGVVPEFSIGIPKDAVRCDEAHYASEHCSIRTDLCCEFVGCFSAVASTSADEDQQPRQRSARK
jgi:hypothetical protein